MMSFSTLALIALSAHSIQIHGHRGARASRPENTIPAFEYALFSGVDVLEMDLGVTKDNALVIVHDQTLNPEICLGKKASKITTPIPIHSLTLKELKTYDCGSLRHPKFSKQVLVPKTKIPTFDEFATWLKNHRNPLAKKVLLNIEMKSEEAHPEFSPSPAEFAKLLVAALEKHGLTNRTIIQSFDFRTLVEARKLLPKSVISLLIEDRPKQPLVLIAKDYNAQILSPNLDWLTAEDVKLAHAAQVQVIPWTANTNAEWRKALSLGVDGIISDDPKGLKTFLKTAK